MQERYQRLGKILNRLYAGERLKIGSLAKEYQVSTKTIQRDLKERLDFCGLSKEGHSFYLKKELGAYGIDYAIVGMLKELAQEIGGEFAYRAMRIFEIMGVWDSGSRLSQGVAENLLLCLKAKQKGLGVNFTYHQESYMCVCVKNVLIFNARLVLQGVFQNQVRYLDIAKLTQVKISHQFCINQEDSYQRDTLSLFIYPKSSESFKKSALAQDAKILEDKDGSLIVEKDVECIDDWISEVMYWIPNVVVLEPQRFKDKITQELQIYLQRI